LQTAVWRWSNKTRSNDAEGTGFLEKKKEKSRQIHTYRAYNTPDPRIASFPPCPHATELMHGMLELRVAADIGGGQMSLARGVRSNLP